MNTDARIPSSCNDAATCRQGTEFDEAWKNAPTAYPALLKFARDRREWAENLFKEAYSAVPSGSDALLLQAVRNLLGILHVKFVSEFRAHLNFHLQSPRTVEELKCLVRLRQICNSMAIDVACRPQSAASLGLILEANVSRIVQRILAGESLSSADADTLKCLPVTTVPVGEMHRAALVLGHADVIECWDCARNLGDRHPAQPRLEDLGSLMDVQSALDTLADWCQASALPSAPPPVDSGDKRTSEQNMTLDETPAQPQSESPPRMSVDLANSSVTLNGCIFCNLPPDAVELFRLMLEKPGEYISASASDIGRPSRLLRQLPGELRAVVDSQRGKGCRLKL